VGEKANIEYAERHPADVLHTWANIDKAKGELGWKPEVDWKEGVDRLVAWYREGADVQACLPLLSTYLGHVNVSGTQAYLTMTPELLAEASKRFDRYSAIGDQENHDV